MKCLQNMQTLSSGFEDHTAASVPMMIISGDDGLHEWA